MYEVNYRYWTPTAIDCYKIGCNCSKCNLINEDFSSLTKKNCKMKQSVIILVKNVGKPKDVIGLDYVIEDNK